MDVMIRYLGIVSAILGVAVCLLSGLARLLGYYIIAEYELTTLFIVGVGMMVFACVLKLYSD